MESESEGRRKGQEMLRHRDKGAYLYYVGLSQEYKDYFNLKTITKNLFNKYVLST